VNMIAAAQPIVWWDAQRVPSMPRFGAAVTLTIDGDAVQAPAGASVLNAADQAGHYIPALCAHPDLWPSTRRGDAGGCQLCMVEVEGRDELQKACSLGVEAGMSVRTDTPRVRAARQAALARILGTHPHVCLTCPQREGCSRTQCSYGNPPATRCCDEFAHCELRKVADHVGIAPTTPAYRPAALPVIKDEPFFDRDYNLCIDCRRCTGCSRGLKKARP